MNEGNQIRNIMESLDRIVSEDQSMSFRDMQNLIYKATIKFAITANPEVKQELWAASQESDAFWVEVFDDLYSELSKGPAAFETMFNYAVDDVAQAMIDYIGADRASYDKSWAIEQSDEVTKILDQLDQRK